MAAHLKPLAAAPVPKEKPAARGLQTVTSRSAAVRSPQGAPIAAAKAKAHFLQLLDEVERKHTPITITKRGRIVARIVPVAPQPELTIYDQMFGRTRGWMNITGDIVSPDHESWGPNWQ